MYQDEQRMCNAILLLQTLLHQPHTQSLRFPLPAVEKRATLGSSDWRFYVYVSMVSCCHSQFPSARV